ncbi:hypothetical protein ACFZA1_21525 [Streptomyces filipinensis]|uniref:hypothetical protein n=1 Tax=Streptomyces filipinensis TaxID=66887 RepID=UPI0004CDB712|nr:hypothetical protein [Streptomyces durhamensis]
MSQQEGGVTHDTGLEKDWARYGLLAVVISNIAITSVAIFGIWRLNGDKAVIVGILTAAFTAVSGMTTAYLGIKAVSNTARSIALGNGPRARQHDTAPAPPTPAPAQRTP